jgi:PAS domain S-box-containing protein
MSLRVLIVEDRPEDAELMLYELGRSGFEPDWHRVETESEYLAHLDPSPDIILADYSLPSFDALRALRHLQERGLDIPFIVVTGTVGEEAAAECIKRGATDYLLKDRLARLGQAVAQALDQGRLRREKRQVEDRLRLQDMAVRSAANAIVITDREGRITAVNPAFTRLTGYSAQEAIGESPRLLKSGQHDQAFYRNLWETILSGRVWSGEVVNRRKDGSLYIEEQTITPVRDERGAISHFIAIKQDVTERKRAEEVLREVHDTLEAVIQASPMGITILDGDGNVRLWNPAAERMFGWGREEVLGRPLPTIPPGRGEEHTSFRERVLKGEACSDVEIIRQRKDGSLIDISLSTAPLRDAEGGIWGAMGIMADISARKRAEEGRARLRAILEATPDFVGIADVHGKAIYLNSSGRKMLGLGDEEDISHHDIADDHPEWAKRIVFDEGIPAAIRDGVWSGETALLSRDGREIPVSQVILAHKAADGSVQFLSTLARDIRGRKRFEAQLEATVEARTRELQAANTELQNTMRRAEEASRHKSTFLANMSHELRTPLNSILGFSELLQGRSFGPLTEKQARYVDNIRTSGQHLLALINDLLDLSKVEAGKLELQLQSLEVREVLEAALHVFRPQAEAKQQALVLEVAGDAPTITADPLRVRQALYNLLSNAVKFTPAGGQVTVTARRVRSAESDVRSETDSTSHLAPRASDGTEFVEISVRDTGIGIGPDDLPKLFQPFTQLEHTSMKRAQGTGLGLALTRRLVELHGGTIWAESEGEGRGASFTIRLPAAGPSGAPRLLLVDDDELLAATLRQALEEAGWEVEVTGDGAAALAQIAATRPNLVILDLRLPTVDGWTVLRRLRANPETRALPVLAVTGIDLERGDEVLTLGADEFLTKPFSLSVLEDTVRRLLQPSISR